MTIMLVRNTAHPEWSQLLGPSHRRSRQCSSQPSWSSICAGVVVDCSVMLSCQLRIKPKLSAPKSPISIRTLPEAHRHIQAEEYKHVWSVQPAHQWLGPLSRFAAVLRRDIYTLDSWRGRQQLPLEGSAITEVSTQNSEWFALGLGHSRTLGIQNSTSVEYPC